jgi:soluble lytic murein transglycosylase-like protein
MFFAPHAGKVIPKAKSSAVTSVSAQQNAADAAPVGMISETTDFRLPPELAFEDIIQEASAQNGVNPDLVRAVVQAESAFDPFAVSSAGAQGLMQLMPALAAELGVEDSFDPRQNIMGGVKYLAWLLDVHHGNVELALASYNAGPGAVDRYHGVPPFKETRQYIKTINGIMHEP